MEKTVFVLGAGASHSVGFPVGTGLRDEIANSLAFDIDPAGPTVRRGDPSIYEALRQEARAIGSFTALEEFTSAAWAISEGLDYAPSIDSFLDNRRAEAKIVRCGKIAIAKWILVHEEHCHLRVLPESGGLDPGKIKGTWYQKLVSALIYRCTWDDLPQRLEQIAFVVFNYDRCLEHFLPFALARAYGRKLEEARELVRRRLRVLHPYGTVGELPWLSSGKDTSIEFGAQLNSSGLRLVAESIRTFTEQADSGIADEIADVVRSATRMVFLGFSFGSENVQLLFPKALSNAQAKVTATVMGMSPSDSDDIRRRLTKLAIMRERIELANCSCADLFDLYGRRLSFVS